MAIITFSKPAVLVIGGLSNCTVEVEQLRSQGYEIDHFDLTAHSQSSAEKILQELADLNEAHRYPAILLQNEAFPLLAPYGERLFKVFQPHLKFVCALGSGFDKTIIDLDYLTRNKIIFANTPIAVAEPTATATLMMILHNIRAVSEVDAYVRSGIWATKTLPGRTMDPRDITVGIIGLGRIGKLVQKKCEAFGMKVIYTGRTKQSESESGGAVFHSLASLLSTADLISLHTPLTKETHHLISDKEFDAMKNGAMIVNTSRGAVIDEEALVRAMERGKVSRASLDVFEHEPRVHPYLIKSNRTTLLPHWAYMTKRCAAEQELERIENYVAWCENGRGNTPVNLPEGGWD